MLINDSVYQVNGREAVFTATTIRGIMSVSPAAVFTFNDGSTITVKYCIFTGKQVVLNGKTLDIEIYYDNGAWKRGNRSSND